mmetsp:Transcript_24973/g.62893  ORF Transcript_24973/g.62893 Transcript_24973/m.62893 type:complete len:184 (-) Transcript_24973:28-579(-)
MRFVRFCFAFQSFDRIVDGVKEKVADIMSDVSGAKVKKEDVRMEEIRGLLRAVGVSFGNIVITIATSSFTLVVLFSFLFLGMYAFKANGDWLSSGISSTLNSVAVVAVNMMSRASDKMEELLIEGAVKRYRLLQKEKVGYKFDENVLEVLQRAEDFYSKKEKEGSGEGENAEPGESASEEAVV